jgi:hypothetical protein
VREIAEEDTTSVRPKASPLLLVALCALGLAPGAGAQPLSRQLEGDGSGLSLASGRGTAAVHSRVGSLLGSLRRGRIAVVDRPAGAKTTIRLYGCEERRRPNPQTRVCIGERLRVKALSGAWQVTFKGRGVNASAVVEGRLRLRGRRGTFSIDGITHPWPSEFRTYVLG